MDDLDKTLLRILKDNARESFVRMAEVLGTSEGTVRARLKKLQDEGVIKKFTIQTAGSNVKALIEISLETNVEMAHVSEQIQKWDGVERVLEVTGEHDIVVIVDVASTTQLNDIIERIRQFKEVRTTRSRLILREY